MAGLASHGDRSRTRTRLRGVAPPDAPEPTATPKTVGRYEIIEVIGRGAMGVVYKARDPLLDRIVAVKTILAPQSLGKSVRKAFLERFEREAKAAARISHPAIVTIFDVGLEAEAPFLVMEYLPGETLADRLDRMRMPLAQGVQCARDLAGALGFAHRERIVHRDVKPANVLHAGDTRWKLADFGIARLPDSDLTQVGIFMGTPGYAPPEAIREGRYTPQADVFAWGAVFYELLCGRVPYEGPDVQTTNGYVLKQEPPSPRVHDPSVPEPLAEVALRAMAHDTRRRYATGAEAEASLAEAWERSLAQGLVPMSAFASTAGPSPRALPPEPSPVRVAVPAGPVAGAKSGPLPASTARPDEPTVVDPEMQARAIEASGSLRVSSETRQTAPWSRPAHDAAAAGGGRLTVEPTVPRGWGRDEDSARLVARPVPEPLAPTASGPAPSRLWIVVSLVLLFLAAAAVAAFYLLRG